ncbi:DUF4129 domain-containing protein (plasmid) [Haloferax sp. S1W]|uniref:DUF4129 domain-containing protein n=1 Tax=Haloferax sp. S1W TaxID=3377110 RepID=UPI0037CA405D
MTTDRHITLVLALVCLFVIGSAAGSLESAVDSSPSDAIDLDYASLPVDKGEASEIKREYQSFTSNSNEQSEPAEKESDGDSEKQSARPSDGGEDQSRASATELTEQLSSTGTNDPRDALGKLLDALRALLSTLVNVLVAALGVVAVALVVKYRARIAARFPSVADRFGRSTSEDTDDDVVPPATPQNEVTEAWYEMVQQLSLDSEEALTPRERAATAYRDGVDASTVWSLTEVFEEVKYGGAPVTEERRERARRCLDRLRHTDGGEGP